MDARYEEVKRLQERIEVLELAVRKLHAMLQAEVALPVPVATREAAYLN